MQTVVKASRSGLIFARAFILTLILPFIWLGPIAPPAFAAAGDTDTSIYFDGSTTTVQMADSAALNMPDAITIEAWVKPTGPISSSTYMVLNKENRYEFYQANGNWGYAFFGTSNWVGVNTGIPARADEWQHIAVTRAAGANTVNFYFNGQLAFTGSADGLGTGSFTTSNYPLQIGSRSNSIGSGFSSFYKGEIDEVRLYKSARTATNILSDMHSYGPVNTANLIEYLDFNDISGTTVTNRSTDSTAGGNLTTYGTIATPSISTTTTLGSDTVVTFTRDYLTANGGWKAPSGISNPRALVVGGGGGGGAAQYSFSAGGGGGGQVSESAVSLTDNTFYPVKVGFGGAGGTSKSTAGTLGDTSTAFSLTSAGGGGGASGQLSTDGSGTAATVGYTGGGGGSYWNTNAYNTGAGTSPRKGGDARTDGSYVDGQAGGGGAGAGGNGGTPATTGSGAAIVATGGTGGVGVSSTLRTDSAVNYGGGGGGGKRTGTSSAFGLGTDGGGNGGFSAAGSNATANRGGGGGGGGNSAITDSSIMFGGGGGSGIVVLRYGINLTTTSTLTIDPGSLIYRTSKNITAVASRVGKIDFKANGKYIPGCRSLVANAGNSYTVVCPFKPATHSPVIITSIFKPTDTNYSIATAVTSPLLPLVRTTNR